MEKNSEYYICGDVAFIPHHNQKKKCVGFSKVDKEDVGRIMECGKVWGLTGDGYSRHSISRTLMHRFIMGMTDQKRIIDHINHNKLDNRKCNLREVSVFGNTQNAMTKKNNTTGRKGVYYVKRSNRYRAQIMANGKKQSLGQYATAEEAGVAYDKAARELHGEFYYNDTANGI